MGIGLSDWRLATAVSQTGQLGTVSGTAVWMVMTRRLQDGDPGGHMRRALEHYPVAATVERILREYYIPGGRKPSRPYRATPMLAHPIKPTVSELLVAASFAEVWLAKEGHDGVVAVNYLEKVQLALLASLYGAMLAGVDYVIMGAGIPFQIAAVLDGLSRHETVSYRITLADDRAGEGIDEVFDPSAIVPLDSPTHLKRPFFLPIVSSHVLAAMLQKRSRGHIDGFIVEGPTAGGHNAPPRGKRRPADNATPEYGPEDNADFEQMRSAGVPFWVAGSWSRPGAIDRAMSVGAHGIQAGSIFALCRDSALRDDLRASAIDKELLSGLEVRTNFTSSPSGYPFKEVALDGTLADDAVYAARKRVCDIGALRTAYRLANGGVGYRCAAEPIEAFVSKGGDVLKTDGSRCLCNALMATIGLPQIRGAEHAPEPALLTLGDDLSFLHDLERPRDYSAVDAITLLLSGNS